MNARGKLNARPPRAARPGPPRASEPLAAGHPAFVIAALVAAACVLASVTFLLTETDFWQHLLVGRAIGSVLHRVPATELWSWPTYGARDLDYAWGFEVLVAPLWSAAGVWGLFAWRWATTLGAFALLWFAARRMGARGLTPLLAVVLGALVYRQRSQIRPETLVAVWIALELWILESRRNGGPDRARWLPPIALAWANTHLSWAMGLVLAGVYLVGDLLARRGREARSLAMAMLASLAVSFVNPFGWRALWEPFRFFLHDRGEPLYRLVSELQPVDWSLNATNGLLALLVVWPALMLWRARRRGWDPVELVLLVLFVPLALRVQRFLGPLALVATPFIARGLDDWVRTRRWPAWTAGAFARATLVSLACVAMIVPELARRDPPAGVGIQWKNYPVGACDYIEAVALRGRVFNEFRSAGYLLSRFWPDPGRRPFMDIHQAGTPVLRARYLDALRTAPGWRALDDAYRFDIALCSRPQAPGDQVMDALDADPSFALVFLDDAAALYVRRGGALAAIAGRDRYHVLAGGRERTLALTAAAGADSGLRARAAAELRREIGASRATALAHSFLANLLLRDGRPGESRDELGRALAIDADTPRAHERLGDMALLGGDPVAAQREFERERRRGGSSARLEIRAGLAQQQLGHPREARAAWRRALAREPGNADARALLTDLDRRSPP